MELDFSTDFLNQNKGLENFLNQNQKNLINLEEKLKQIQQELNDLKNNVDNSLKQVEMDFQYNQSILERWVSGSNNKLKQEQISDARKIILDNINTINDTINQLSMDFENLSNQFATSAQEMVTNYKNLENSLNNMFEQVEQSNIQYTTPDFTQTEQSLQHNLQKVIDSLNNVQKEIDERQVLNDIEKGLNQIQ